MENELKLHSISDDYINYLIEKEPNVYSNKEDNRIHTRKYVGEVLKIGDFCYYIPMSSPKRNDYQFAGNTLVIKKSIVPIIRIIVKNRDGEKELKGTLRISHMIPVPESELELYDIENEKDLDYKELVHDQIQFIRKNKAKIEKCAKLLYKQKLGNDNSANYVKIALDYKKIETFCLEYQNNKKTKMKKNWMYQRENKMIEIRKATAADAEKILECCKLIGAESDNLTFGSEGVSITVEQEREYLDSLYHSDRQLYLVAENDGEIVGTCCFSSYGKPRLAHRGEVSISVRKSMWGQRIGTRFMEELMDFARNVAKVEIISLEVRSDNERAVRLYKKFGFETVGVFEGFLKINGEDVSCDIMRLKL